MELNLTSVADLQQANICRCCLRSVRRYFNTVSEDYYPSRARKNYEEMLLNTFNIQVTRISI